MAPDCISFGDAEKLINEHGKQFARKHVVGVGIADRNDRLCFVVAVKNKKTRDLLKHEFEGKRIADFPICFEMRNVKSLECETDLLPTVAESGNLMSRVCLAALDRPGYLIMATFLLVAILSSSLFAK